MKHEPDTIPWNGLIPVELLEMIKDYVNITNHLIALGLYLKIGSEVHYYPLAEGDESGKQKPIPPDRENCNDSDEFKYSLKNAGYDANVNNGNR